MRLKNISKQKQDNLIKLIRVIHEEHKERDRTGVLKCHKINNKIDELNLDVISFDEEKIILQDNGETKIIHYKVTKGKIK